MRLKKMSERKEKVEKIYFETERKKSSKCKENIGVFPWEENVGKIPTFSRGKKKYIIT
jgi:hypothetical protein|nr:MAG: hypothetical protein [Bacteriophage sp.]DAY71266.1 MAG TPA: hypothetical protein [Caudoviricetes sp.]